MENSSGKNVYTYEYLPWREISANTFKTYDCLTKIDMQGRPISIGFRYPNDSYKVRLLDKKEFYTVGDSKPDLFGRNLFAAGSHKYVTITEGELDALSLYQVIKSPVVSVRSSGSSVADVSSNRSWLNSYERIYIAFDNDAAGREAAAAVAKLFDYDKVFVVRFTNRKDANEYLQAGEADELRNIWWNSKRFLPETLTSGLGDFEEILSEAPTLGVPYPFPSITHKTYGLRTGETVLLTAQEGVGKTEIMHAIEYSLLTETEDNVGAIFLEEPSKRHLQALAGIRLQKPVHLPDCDASTAEVCSAIRETIKKDDRLFVYRSFGNDSPELLLDAIRFLVSAVGCRWILLDHLNMAVSGMAEEDERRKLDFFSTRSEIMVKELDFGFIVVSHVNDLGQTRGSRYIGKCADIRIDLDRDVFSTNDTVRNTVLCTISKNRFAGRTGSAGKYLFDPLKRTFTELTTGG